MMAIWKYSSWDAVMFILSISHTVVTVTLVMYWDHFTIIGWLVNIVLLTLMTTYNIIVISHFFTHTPWFVSHVMNVLVSILNSMNIGQSYHLSHVRNHHKYNNDRGVGKGGPQDTSSTFINGTEIGEHSTLWNYSVLGAVSTFYNSFVRMCWSLFIWHKPLSKADKGYEKLLSNAKTSKIKELWQLRLDRVFQAVWIIILFTLSWEWTLFCYLPSLYFAFVLVNIQNYYEHYGAQPESRFANSVSYYGRIYNLFMFNDGYHQEHHISGNTHWKLLPDLRRKYSTQLSAQKRIISPVPAILGFLHRRRSLLHRSIRQK
ncbi:fatty acid desaturase [Photorhabdus sp. APURE]|uniref:fatty acid desaturase family protein n=1 Tax=Photorhabdus aballayi TaxID=2991723 RepID=UPI00223D119D|nr:fatty acid desaturase [Photorhabdus aballayi]MCW7550953.1 fatty acid desaturase [Photorhabdus aballayi]